ncbi:unnamed protein product [Pleuronectes platessa]|uniref:C2H2-type domain-containing protein n=1 Tax=Pleuronectes platessa TaxID=8262 RepID=A0A9N7UQZ1_PLEPL|nr:unnamed protein product [Pleuronectes platessa]
MTKTGKPDAYWEGIMYQYAQGKYRFSTDKKPGSKKWKAVMQLISSCPLTPIYNLPIREIDIFGGQIACKCRYHKSGASGSQQRETGSGSSSGRLLMESAHSIPSAGSQLTDVTPQSIPSAGSQLTDLTTQSIPSAASQLTDLTTQSIPSAGRQPARSTSSCQIQEPIHCALCSKDIHAEFFSEHLSDFHAEQTCEQCGKNVTGVVGLLQHIEEGHSGLSRESGNPSLQPQPTPPQQRRLPRPKQQRPPLPQLKLPPQPQLQQQRPPPPQLQLPPPQLQLPPPPSQQQQPPPSQQQHTPTPPPSFPATSPYVVHLRPPVVNWVQCVTFLKPRTVGNSSSYLQQALEEVHSEEWGRRTVEYLSDCKLHSRRNALTQYEPAAYGQPPTYRTLPLAQWFERVHVNEILGHLDEMKGVITSTYGRILKLDSTKKITKKLAGDIADSATWMTNVTNECGQLLNCVLTTGEGAGLDELCQRIVKRYKKAGEPEAEVIYVDRDCCSGTGTSPVLSWLRPWKTILSHCIFEWDQEDIRSLKEAKKSELQKQHAGHAPTEAQVLANISSSELGRHCKRRTRGVEETRRLIDGLLESMWELTDTTGLRLINPESMTNMWQGVLFCGKFSSPPVHIYPGLEV